MYQNTVFDKLKDLRLHPRRNGRANIGHSKTDFFQKKYKMQLTFEKESRLSKTCSESLILIL
jgi:hypothetical protein